MTPRLILALILSVAVLGAWARLIPWRRGVAAGPSRPWRLAALLALQPACAALVFLCLYPPGTQVVSGTLTVSTAGAPAGVPGARGRVIVLPEAPATADRERSPDLATALRRHPDVGRIRVVGQGLTARDRDAVRGLAVDFDPTSPPPGLTSLDPPRRVAPGAGFQAGGEVSGLPGATAELFDPAGRLTDRRATDAAGRFIVSGTARAAGPVVFVLRIRDAGGRIVEQADLPVLVDGGAAPRVLILAGAPGPEVKYLRRWASDAGFAVTTQMSAGGGVALGDAPVSIDAGTLRRFDIAVIDERSWDALGARRGAVLAAVREGMGLALRPSGPLDDAARGQWRALGFSMAGAGGVTPLVLPAAPNAEILRTRRGIGSADRPVDLDTGEMVLPEISRLGLTPGGADVVPLIRDGGGATLAAWRALGRGRVAVFTGVDAYGMILTGRGDLYGDWWSAILSAVGRPATASAPAFNGPAWVGERVVPCGLGTGAEATGPDGATTRLRPEPGPAGCAAYWPRVAGWHGLRQAAEGPGAAPSLFYVQPVEALGALKAMRDRQATLMLHSPDRATPERTVERPGSSWPWFLAWLTLTSLLWWLERSRIGRAVTAPVSPAGR